MLCFIYALYEVIIFIMFKIEFFVVVVLSSQKNNWLYQVSVGQCLAVVDPLSIKGYVAMAICEDSRSQQWQLEG